MCLAPATLYTPATVSTCTLSNINTTKERVTNQVTVNLPPNQNFRLPQVHLAHHPPAHLHLGVLVLGLVQARDAQAAEAEDPHEAEARHFDLPGHLLGGAAGVLQHGPAPVPQNVVPEGKLARPADGGDVGGVEAEPSALARVLSGHGVPVPRVSGVTPGRVVAGAEFLEFVAEALLELEQSGIIG